MKRILLLLTCASLLPLPSIKAGNSAAAGVLGGVAGFALGSSIASSRRSRPVEVREVHYTTVPAQTTTVTSNGSELLRLERKLNAAIDENRQLGQELLEGDRKNRELLKKLDNCDDEIKELKQLAKEQQQEIQKLQRELRKQDNEIRTKQAKLELEDVK